MSVQWTLDLQKWQILCRSRRCTSRWWIGSLLKADLWPGIYIYNTSDVPSPTSRWEGVWTIINGSVSFGVRRKPSDMSTFVGTIVGIVSGKRKRPSLFYLGIGLYGARYFDTVVRSKPLIDFLTLCSEHIQRGCSTTIFYTRYSS
jgi:hypothetical protein